MPSEERSRQALQALAAPRERFLSAVATAVEQVRGYLNTHRTPPAGPVAQSLAELGGFAAGRIDAARFAALFQGGDPLDAASLARVERALGVLQEVAAAGDDLFHVSVASGADLYGVVNGALARAGRAFGAAQTVELVRTGRFRVDEHGDQLYAFPFRRWNRAERQIAPPLVVEVDGADLRAGVLAEFLDGAQKIVLIVHGLLAPAPLARLVTPGVFVLQTTDPAELKKLAATEAPAVAALVGEGAARFTHDPAAGQTLAARLAVQALPTDRLAGPLGGLSAFQMADELRHLELLATGPHPPTASPNAGRGGERQEFDGGPPLPPAGEGVARSAGGEGAVAGSRQPEAGSRQPTADSVDTVDQLAAWLLRQADLSGLA